MYYYSFVVEIDNPILMDLSKRKLTIYEKVWSDSPYLFRQYVMKSLEYRKDFIGQEIQIGVVQTIDDLKKVVTRKYKYDDFDEFYKLGKLKMISSWDHTTYLLSSIGRLNYLKVKIKRELVQTKAGAITRLLLLLTFIKRFGKYKQNVSLGQLMGYIHQLHHIIRDVTPDTIDKAKYVTLMTDHSQIHTNIYVLQ